MQSILARTVAKDALLEAARQELIKLKDLNAKLVEARQSGLLCC